MTYKDIKKIYFPRIKIKFLSIPKDELLSKTKNIFLQFSAYLNKKYNGYFGKLNLIRKYFDSEIKLNLIKSETNHLISETKKETDTIKRKVIWAVVYALSSVINIKNYKFAICFMLYAIRDTNKDIDLEEVFGNIKI